MPKFFEVEFTVVAVVEAEDEAGACETANDCERDIFRDSYNLIPAVNREVTSLKHLRDGWDGECIPYGGDGNTRLKDLLPDA